MRGYPVLWIPGFDHAGIATQMMVEKYLSKTKGISKSDIGREQFLSHIWQWKYDKEDVIKSQIKALGASLDWSREYFTMSKVLTRILWCRIFHFLLLCRLFSFIMNISGSY